MIYPLARKLAATGAQNRVPVAVTCRVLKIVKQSCYRWLKAPVTDRDWQQAKLINAAKDLYAEGPQFGYRLIADDLAHLGFQSSERRVWRLCSQNGITSTVARRKRGKDTRPRPPMHDDLVHRVFIASRPKQLWLTDITEHRSGEGKRYLCVIKDMFSNLLVGD